MTKLEQMAEDFNESAEIDFHQGCGHWRVSRDAYIAGFKEAREMAANDASDWDDTELRCMNDCCLKISDRIKTVGDEPHADNV